MRGYREAVTGNGDIPVKAVIPPDFSLFCTKKSSSWIVLIALKVPCGYRTVQNILSRAKKGKNQSRMYGLNENPWSKPPMFSGANLRAWETEIVADAGGK